MGARLRGRPARRLAHRAARRCRRSSSGAARSSSSPLSTPSSTGWANSPYAVAKAGVESLGRALRVELAPHGASATVAYFGWVDTKLVQDAFAQPDAQRLNEITPDFLLKRISPTRPGPAFVRGIEERAPRVFAPKWWRYVSALRGLINPLLDRAQERDREDRGALEVEARPADAHGRRGGDGRKSDLCDR